MAKELTDKNYREQLSKTLGQLSGALTTYAQSRGMTVNSPAPTTPTLQTTTTPVKTSDYSGGSIVDYLSSVGQESSFSARQTLAQQYGINDYRGTAEQNTQLLTSLRANPTQPSSPAGNGSQGNSGASAGVDNGEIARMLGELGVSFGDYQSITSRVTPAERKAIADEFGISDLEASVFAKPEKSTEQLFKSAYKTSGLADIKEQINQINDEIEAEREQLREATGAIDENPFLTETSRVGRGKRVLEQAQSSIGNKLEQVKRLTDLYNSGIGEIESMIARSTTDFENDRALNQAKLNYMLKQVENQVSEMGATKANENLSSYLSGRQLGEAPDVVGSASTGYYQYDRTTGKYVRLGGGGGSSSDSGTGSGGSGSGGGSTVKSFEEFAKSDEAMQLIEEEQNRRLQTMTPDARKEYLRSVYDEVVAQAQPSSVELKNLTATNKRDLQQAGLTGASGNAQSFFLASDAGFRDLIKQGVALGEIPQGLTLSELKEYYDAYLETETSSKSSSKRTP